MCLIPYCVLLSLLDEDHHHRGSRVVPWPVLAIAVAAPIAGYLAWNLIEQGKLVGAVKNFRYNDSPVTLLV